MAYLILPQLYQNKLLCEMFMPNMKNRVEGDEMVAGQIMPNISVLSNWKNCVINNFNTKTLISTFITTRSF
jgi:hypothetical protein